MPPDKDAEIDPISPTGCGHLADPKLKRLSDTLKEFNKHFGDIAWQDADHVRELITKPFRHGWPRTPPSGTPS